MTSIAFDSASEAFDSLVGGAGDGIQWTHTTGANARGLFVGIVWTITTAGSFIPTLSVTAAGAALQQVGSTLLMGASRRELWRLLGPPRIGGQTIRIEPSFAFDGAIAVTAGAVSVSGTLPYVRGGPNAASGSSTTPSTVVPGVLAPSIVLDLLAVSHGAAFATRTAGAGQTKRVDPQVLATGDVGTRISCSMSTEDSVGAVTMSWTLSAIKAWGLSGFEIGAAPE